MSRQDSGFFRLAYASQDQLETRMRKGLFMATDFTFQAENGHETTGVLATPDGSAKAGGVVLIQEWWGVNDHIKGIAARLADAGFLVLAPDLYHGRVTKDRSEAASLLAALDWDRALKEIGGAMTALKNHERSNGKVAAVGFCMGGGLTLAAASRYGGAISAAVPFYGLPRGPNFNAGLITAPVLGHYAEQDDHISLDEAKRIASEVNAAKGNFELHVYRAQHAFFNDSRPEVYDAAAARLAWDRMLSFLRAHLS